MTKVVEIPKRRRYHMVTWINGKPVYYMHMEGNDVAAFVKTPQGARFLTENGIRVLNGWLGFVKIARVYDHMYASEYEDHPFEKYDFVEVEEENE